MLNFTIVKLSLCIIAGVLLGNLFHIPVSSLFPAGIAILGIFTFSYFRAAKLFLQDYFFGICTILLFIFFGFTAATLHLPQNNPHHYIHQTTEGTTDLFIAEISEKLKPGAYQDKYILKVRKSNDTYSTGKVLLNLYRNSTVSDLPVGSVIAIAAEVKRINPPLNPYQFDYSKYMENLGVLRQINASSNQIFPLEKKQTGASNIAGEIRATIVSKLRQYNFKPEELAIIQALLLGQRQEISQEVYSNYAAAGVIHILAVSGLHVGIILIMLNKIFKPLERMPRSRLLKTVLLILLMWGFALLAGLSPSVVRAVSMFSFVAVGMQLKRRTSVLNSLFISLLVLLLINPPFLTQVGFQLSYAAVISIVLVQPHLYTIYKGNSPVIKFLWGILSVTIAAQIGVLPLSLYYFHQFPGLFFISNLLILPFLGLILGMGILIMLLALVDLLPKFLASTFEEMISFLNRVVQFIAAKEDFIFRDISFSLALCMVSYFVVAGFILLLKKGSYQRILFFLITIVALQFTLISEEYSAGNNEAIVFHKSRNSVIAERSGRNLLLFHNLEDAPMAFSFIRDYSVEKDIKKITELPLRNIFSIHNKLIFRIDSSGIYNIPDLSPNILLLTNSPRINLERVITDLKPELIIADGSNFPSLVNRWKATAKKEKLPFHATAEKGAFLFNPSGEGN